MRGQTSAWIGGCTSRDPYSLSSFFSFPLVYVAQAEWTDRCASRHRLWGLSVTEKKPWFFYPQHFRYPSGLSSIRIFEKLYYALHPPTHTHTHTHSESRKEEEEEEEEKEGRRYPLGVRGGWNCGGLGAGRKMSEITWEKLLGLRQKKSGRRNNNDNKHRMVSMATS